jgi:hypothetical protein
MESKDGKKWEKQDPMTYPATRKRLPIFPSRRAIAHARARRQATHKQPTISLFP